MCTGLQIGFAFFAINFFPGFQFLSYFGQLLLAFSSCFEAVALLSFLFLRLLISPFRTLIASGERLYEYWQQLQLSKH